MAPTGLLAFVHCVQYLATVRLGDGAEYVRGLGEWPYIPISPCIMPETSATTACPPTHPRIQASIKETGRASGQRRMGAGGTR